MRVLIKVIQNSIVETINNSGKKDLEFQSESMLLYWLEFIEKNYNWI